MNTEVEKIKKIMQEYSCGTQPCSDKASCHAYEQFYPKVFLEYIDKNINLLEIGIASGASLKMWQKIFPLAKIYGSDSNYKKIMYSKKDFENIVLLPEGDQTNFEIYKDIPTMDIIIDDASHIASNSMKTFYLLENKLNKNGIYVIEDVWEEQLQQYPRDFLLKFEMIDLRKYKKRADDILLVYKK